MTKLRKFAWTPVKSPTLNLKLKLNKEIVQQEAKDYFQIIEKILLTGSSKLSEQMISGLAEMLKILGKDGEQTTNQEITTVKFYRLVLFNCTFYLSKNEKNN